MGCTVYCMLYTGGLRPPRFILRTLHSCVMLHTLYSWSSAPCFIHNTLYFILYIIYAVYSMLYAYAGGLPPPRFILRTLHSCFMLYPLCSIQGVFRHLAASFTLQTLYFMLYAGGLPPPRFILHTFCFSLYTGFSLYSMLYTLCFMLCTVY